MLIKLINGEWKCDSEENILTFEQIGLMFLATEGLARETNVILHSSLKLQAEY